MSRLVANASMTPRPGSRTAPARLQQFARLAFGELGAFIADHAALVFLAILFAALGFSLVIPFRAGHLRRALEDKPWCAVSLSCVGGFET